MEGSTMSGGDMALVIAAIVVSNLVTAWISWGWGFSAGVHRATRQFTKCVIEKGEHDDLST